MIKKAPWDEIAAFGNPWHGKMSASGLLTLANGTTKQGVAPLTTGFIGVAPGNLFSRTGGGDGLLTLVKFDGIGAAPVVLTAEATEGMVWNNYAILASSNRQYSPMVNAGLGDNTWLYRTTDLEVWMVKAAPISNTVLQVSTRRLNLLNDPWVTLTEHTLPAGSSIIQSVPLVASKPNGKEAIVHICDVSTNVAYVTVTVANGTKDAPPTAACVNTLGQRRAVTGNPEGGAVDWSKEEFAGIRYLIDGQRREIWLGSSQAFTSGGNVETYKNWVWIGGQRTDVMTRTRTNNLGTFTGTTTFFGNTYNYQAQSTDDTPSLSIKGWQRENRGVECSLSNIPNTAYKRVSIGIVSNTLKSYDVAAGQDLPIFCEHPITGQFLDGARWVF